MKRCFFISCMFLFMSILAFSQEEQNLREVYCEIVGTGNLTGTKVKIEIDFGQRRDFWTHYKDKILLGEDGKPIKFNSMVDAMNYMGRFGWKFKQAYVVTSDFSKQNVYHWLLAKEISKDEELKEGINVNEGKGLKKQKTSGEGFSDDVYF